MVIKITDNQFLNVGTALHVDGVPPEIEFARNHLKNVGTGVKTTGGITVPQDVLEQILSVYAAHKNEGHSEAVKAAAEAGQVKKFFVDHGYSLAQIALAVGQIVQAALK